MERLRNRSGGLTLVELVVTLAVAVILALIAAPLFTSITANNAMSSATNLLSGHMQLARSEAVKRGNAVTICPSGDGVSCAGTNQWAVGWLVFEDLGVSGQVDDGDTPIAVSPSLDGDVTIGSSHVFIRYLPDGTIDLP